MNSCAVRELAFAELHEHQTVVRGFAGGEISRDGVSGQESATGPARQREDDF